MKNIHKIEVEFAVPVEITSEQEQALIKLIGEIAKANTPSGLVHWVCGVGFKPTFSQQDCEFLGKPVDPNAPESSEPTFDDTIFHIETSAREK